MKLSEIYAVLDKVAPKRLSDEYCRLYDAYDNSGVLVDTGAEIEKILFTLDLTHAALEEAKSIGAGLIVTHHPVIYGGKKCLTQEEPMDKALMECIQFGISVISMHLNVDVAKGGIDESLCEAVIQAAAEASDNKTTTKRKKVVELMHPLQEGGYGRAYAVDECILHELSQALQKRLGCQRTHVYGTKETVKKVVSCCGAGADEEAVAFAQKVGADVLVSADFKHHVILAALERGVSVLAPTHYATENYGFKNYFMKISKAIKIPCVYHEDKQLL